MCQPLLRVNVALFALTGLFVPCSWALSQDITSTNSAPTAGMIRADIPDQRSLWRGLARLNMKISEARFDTNLGNLLHGLSSHCGVRLEAYNAELRLMPISFACRNVPLKAVLDAAASFGVGKWESTTSHTLILRLVDNPYVLDRMHAHTASEAIIYSEGKRFLDELARQPKDLQHRIDPARFENFTDWRSQKGVAFTDLPRSMQKMLQIISEAKTQQMAADGRVSPLTSSNLNTVRLNFVTREANGFSNCTFEIWHGYSFDLTINFNVFRDAAEQSKHYIPQDQVKALVVEPEEMYRLMALSRQRAIAADPRLKARVTLPGGLYSLTEALSLLSEKANISLLAQPTWGGITPQQIPDFQDVPLQDVLERLTQLYSFNLHHNNFRYYWSMRKSGIFLFQIIIERTPQLNPLPDRKELVKVLTALPADFKNKLMDKAGIPFAELPTALRQAIKSMEASDTQVIVDAKVSAVEDCSFRLNIHDFGDLSGYNLEYAEPGQLLWWNFTFSNKGW